MGSSTVSPRSGLVTQILWTEKFCGHLDFAYRDVRHSRRVLKTAFEKVLRGRKGSEKGF